MRKLFGHYYPPTPLDLEVLWKEGVVVLDANVLLNLYRYSDPTRNELLRLLKELKDRLWLPYQAALEFHKRRLQVIWDEHESYRNFLASFDELTKELESTRSHPYVAPATSKALTKLREDLGADFTKSQTSLKALDEKDVVLDEVTAAYGGRVGRTFSDKELQEIYAEGEVRYKKLIPPGFEDRAKPGDDKYGDLVLWKQLLAFVATSKKPVIFVTDDSKQDWWLEHKGRTVGPHPALKAEIELQSGKPFHMYKSLPFIERASAQLKKPIRREAIAEVQQAQQESATIRLSTTAGALRRMQAVDIELGKPLGLQDYLERVRIARLSLTNELETIRARLGSVTARRDELDRALMREHFERMDRRQAERMTARRDELDRALMDDDAALISERQTEVDAQVKPDRSDQNDPTK